MEDFENPISDIKDATLLIFVLSARVKCVGGTFQSSSH